MFLLCIHHSSIFWLLPPQDAVTYLVSIPSQERRTRIATLDPTAKVGKMLALQLRRRGRIIESDLLTSIVPHSLQKFRDHILPLLIVMTDTGDQIQFHMENFPALALRSQCEQNRNSILLLFNFLLIPSSPT